MEINDHEIDYTIETCNEMTARKCAARLVSDLAAFSVERLPDLALGGNYWKFTVLKEKRND